MRVASATVTVLSPSGRSDQFAPPSSLACHRTVRPGASAAAWKTTAWPTRACTGTGCWTIEKPAGARRTSSRSRDGRSRRLADDRFGFRMKLMVAA
ncbi:hypothetical protein [Paludisphaera soli]|uniref:hypothetical protein n=1 Tax=Paludisphaera soli TaxID=2712865 RepID=UPI0013EA2144|nr:hypothetical protein [Paludisphaera soli]